MKRWGSLLTSVAIAVVVALLVTWLRATAPVSPTDAEVVLPDLPELTCEDLADDDTPLATGDDGAPGRALSGQVLSCPFAFDGLLVTYVGEVVGDVLERDGGSWVLANDDPYALEQGPLTAGGTPAGTNSGLTLWLPDPLDELVDQPGRPERRGDVLAVTGRVNRADPADGGGLTIRVEEAEVLAEAVDLDVPVHWRQVAVAVALAVAALAVLWRERQRRER